MVQYTVATTVIYCTHRGVQLSHTWAAVVSDECPLNWSNTQSLQQTYIVLTVEYSYLTPGLLEFLMNAHLIGANWSNTLSLQPTCIVLTVEYSIYHSSRTQRPILYYVFLKLSISSIFPVHRSQCTCSIFITILCDIFHNILIWLPWPAPRESASRPWGYHILSIKSCEAISEQNIILLKSRKKDYTFIHLLYILSTTSKYKYYTNISQQIYSLLVMHFCYRFHLFFLFQVNILQ